MNLPTIVITGASSGIGASVARRFANTHRLVLLARREEKLSDLKKELRSTNIELYKCDVTSKDEVEQVFSQIKTIDVLVNNAGGAFGLDFAQAANLDDWEKCIDVNVKGLMYCTHAALPMMCKENRGHIFNIGSIAGSYPYPKGNAYCGAKAFVHQFSLCLKADLFGTKVRVTCIEPGLLGNTEFSQVRLGDEEKAKKIYENSEPLEPEDVAEVVFFCNHLPSRVNINTLEMMPVCQSFSPLQVYRS